jgi:hypothetical protein
MPVAPVTATLLQSSPNGYRSKLTATPLSSATGSIDTLTIAHQLPTVDEVRVAVRSVVTAGGLSGQYAVPIVLSYNCSQAVITLPLIGSAAMNVLVDVIVEQTHSMVR